MRWITREHIKVDRVACPGLIKRFVDPNRAYGIHHGGTMTIKMASACVVGSLILATATLVIEAQQTTTSGLNTTAIDQALGMTGQMQGDVYRVGMPRTDLSVTVHGIAIKPGLALGSWAGFRKAGTQAVVHGDLVLTDTEINPVISKLYEGGLQITALHN